MNRSRIQILAVIVTVSVLLGAVMIAVQLGSVASAQEEPVVEPMAVSGTTSTLLQYQGRLSDPGSGEPVADGSYTMVLRLYSAPSGGTALWTETKDVPVQGGLFSTVLGDSKNLNHSLFNGRALWLGIKVGSDVEAKPRQQVLPVAYALSLVPGATIKANSSGAALSVSNSGSGRALNAGGSVIVDGNLTVNGSLSGGTHTHSSHNNNASAHHTRYSDAEAVSAALNSNSFVDQYSFDDHIYGGMHSNRALASGSINGDGSIAAATGNVSSRWDSQSECYEITIDGHTYDWYYVTVVTPVSGGGIANAWSQSGKLCVGIYALNGNSQKQPFQFVTFQP